VTKSSNDWLAPNISKQGKYDAALRDYKKGKFILESRPNQLLPNNPVAQTPTVEHQEEMQRDAEIQQKRIFDKVWSNVEKVMGSMRGNLLTKLKEVGRPIDDQEKIIEYVILDDNSFKLSSLWQR